MRILGLSALFVGVVVGCTTADPAGGVGDGGSAESSASGAMDEGGSTATQGDGGSGEAADGVDSGSGLPPGERYHPMGFAAADMHGLAAKLATEDCRACHGGDLKGVGEAASCDGCHQAGWRTDCVFCHGGEGSELGAPPRDIDGSSLLEDLAFRAHAAHVTEGNHAVFDCTHCHDKPTDVLTPGHLFDGTPGLAEVAFGAGLSPNGTYEAGTCANLYCHGNGNGTLGGRTDGDPTPTCAECHADTTTPTLWTAMSGQHKRHLEQGLSCSECHAATVTSTGSIVQPLLHVDGNAEVVLNESGINRNGATCTGACHNKVHFNEVW